MAWHAAAPAGLRRLTATAGPAGIVLGRQHSGALAPVRLFRPEPTRVAVVGGAWLASLIAFRCLGVGAQVEVTTANPARWSTVGGQAGAAARLTVRGAADTRAPAAGGGLRPVLRVNDVGAGTAEEPGAWEASLMLLPLLTPTVAPALPPADVLVLQRLSRDEAEVCAATLHLSAEDETRLTQLHDDLLVVVVGGVPQFLWFATTPVEEELFGPPRRA